MILTDHLIPKNNQNLSNSVKHPYSTKRGVRMNETESQKVVRKRVVKKCRGFLTHQRDSKI